jgi:hypothetical protein
MSVKQHPYIYVACIRVPQRFCSVEFSFPEDTENFQSIQSICSSIFRKYVSIRRYVEKIYHWYLLLSVDALIF